MSTGGAWSGGEPLELRSPSGELQATFLPHLGMIGSSLRHLGDELLGQRGGPEAYAERMSTFGIPLLHPWANRLSEWDYEWGGPRIYLDRESPVLKADPDTGLPIHGALGACRHWQLTDVAADRTGAQAVLDYGAHPELMEVFPFHHHLEFRTLLSDHGLTVGLRVTATGEEPVPISFGFHPYLTLPGGSREEWELELPVSRRAMLDRHGIPTGEHEPLAPGALSGPLGSRTFDDSFDELYGDRPVFALADSRRRVEIRYEEGYPVAQVYAPEGSSFIAVEPMTAPVNALRSGQGLRFVAPGERFAAQFTIAVSRL